MAPNAELCQQGSISLHFLCNSELNPFYEFPVCERSVQGKAQCLEATWSFRSGKAAVRLCIIFERLIPLCCITQWTILTAPLFLSMNFTEERLDRGRRQCVYPAPCLWSSESGSRTAFRVTDYKGWYKSHLHTTLREDFSLLVFTHFILCWSLKQACWAHGKQFRWAQKGLSKMKIFGG